MKLLQHLFVLLVLSATAAESQAVITWNFDFEDVTGGTGVGFDDPVFGATRRATVQAVTDYIDTVLDESGTADIDFKPSQTDGGGFLAAAAVALPASGVGFTNGALFEHAHNGSDVTGASVPDANVTFDFGFTWNSEQDTPASGEFDLFSVLLHELTHTLGFFSLLNSGGRSQIGNNDPGVFSVYDSFLEKGDGTKLFSGSPGDFTGAATDLVSNDLFFDGPNLRSANADSPIKIFAPSSFQPGSSLSHLNSSTFTMSPGIAPAQQKRVLSGQEIGILEDIGWTIASASANPVPEPSSLALMATGATVVGAAVRRRRKRT